MTTIGTSGSGRAMNANAFLRTHPLVAYFALTFAISWGAVLVVVGPHGFPGTAEQVETLLPLAVVAMLTGPPIASIVLTWLIDGRAGVRGLSSRLLEWRVDARWYALALLTAPLVATTVLLGLSSFLPEYIPGILATDEPTSRLVFGVTVAIGAGLFEEIGWTGFAVPRLRLRHSVLGTGLILGLVWGAWHLLVNLWASRTFTGTVPVPLYLSAGLFSSLLAFRVAMVWVYDRTGSLLLSVLMHGSLTACALLLSPPTTGVRLLTYDLVLAAALWAVVASLVVRHDGRRPIVTTIPGRTV